MMPGGTTEAKPACEEVQQLLHTVRPQVEEKLGHPVSQFTLVSYKTQVVAGTNYFAKIDIGEDVMVHVRVYRDLSGSVSLSNMQHPKTRHEDIHYF